MTERTRFILGVNDGVATTNFNDTTTIVSSTVATPAITTIAAMTTLNIGTSQPVPFSIAGLDTSASNFTITATSSNTSVVASVALGGSGAARTLTLVPVAGANGTTTITITATQGAQTVTRTFTVNVGLFAATMATGSLTFSAQPGQTYLVEKRSDLTAGVWTVESTIIATTESITAPLATAPSSQMFYRVRTVY